MVQHDLLRRSRDVVFVARVVVATVLLTSIVVVATAIVGYVAVLALCDAFYRWRN